MRFHTATPIGRGGTGEVLKAWDPTLDRPVAIKLLRRDDPDAVARMAREARAQARVEHPNVCRIYEVGESDGRPFIAMQLIEGVPLDQAVQGLPVERKVRLVEAVARGVHAAHAAGLIHRDLKPANVLVESGEDGALHPYVLDFGIARERAAEGLTATGEVLGTPGYMSPEQVRGDIHALDRRSDVYSLGATLFHLLAGRPPFTGDNPVEAMMEVLQSDAPPLARIAPQIPADLATIVDKCLEADPGRRYASARALADDLLRFLDGEPVTARPAGWLYRTGKRLRRHRWVAAVGAVSLVAVLVLGAVALSTRLRSAERAEIAERFGQRVERMDNLMRLAHLLPLHDVRPDRERVRAELAAIEREMGERGRAARGPGRLALGAGHLALGELDTAREHLAAAWEDGYREPRVAYGLGRILADEYRRELAAVQRLRDDDLRRARLAAVDRDYRQPTLAYLRAAEGAAGAPELLAAETAFVEGRWDDADRRATGVLDELPWLYEAAVLRGDAALARAGEERGEAEPDGDAPAAFERSIEHYRHATRTAPSDPRVHAKLCFAASRWMEVLHFDAGGDPEPARDLAEAACADALAADPGSAEAHVFLAGSRALWGLHQVDVGADPEPAFDSAVAAARRAIELDPDNASAHRRLGDAYTYLAEHVRYRGEGSEERVRAAVAALSTAVELDPDSAGNHNSLGLAYWELQSLERESEADPLPTIERAVAAFRRAAELVPDYAYAHSNLGAMLNQRAEHQIEHGLDPSASFEGAIAAFERAIEANPSYAYAYNNLGNAHLHAGEHALAHGRDPSASLERALTLYDRSLERNPKWAFPALNAGIAHYRFAQHALLAGEDPAPHLERARERFEHGLTLRPGFAPVYVELARCRVLGARGDVERDRSPEANLAAARRQIERAGTPPPLLDAVELAGEVELLTARWRARRDRDPRPALDDAERTLARVLGENERRPVALTLLAETALERAQWQRERGAEPAAGRSLDRGVGWAEASLAVNANQAETVALLARLRLEQALLGSDSDSGGGAAGDAARHFERAFELNPLLARTWGPAHRRAASI